MAVKSLDCGTSGSVSRTSGSSAVWQYGWTHYGTSGQTPARLHLLTRAVEIRDGGEWVRCAAGADTFFTPGFIPA